MRIALVTRRFDPGGGGTERDLLVTAEYLLRADHRVVIYAGELRGRWDQCPVRRVPTRALGRALRLWRQAYLAPAMARAEGAELVLSFARAVGADVLRVGGGAHASYVGAARRWRGALGASAMRLSPYHRVQMALERRAFGWPRLRLVIAVSRLVRGQLVERFGLAPEKVRVLYNGVDLERFRPARDGAARRERRQALGVPASARLVLFVGNGFARKGLGALLEAWPLMRGVPWLMVVGHDRAAEHYRRRARALKVAERVLFAGARDDVAELFQAADALAMPALFEPFGNVVLEAMASGLKVMTSIQAGAAELLPHECGRFTVRNPSDPGEIRQRLEALLEAPAALGEEARAAAEAYPWKRYGDELLGLLDSLA